MVKSKKEKTAEKSPAKGSYAAASPGKGKTRFHDRRDYEHKALRSITNRYPSWTRHYIEKPGPTGKSWLELATEQMMSKEG
eukprot:11158513-Prorocentrum_lima.AAC.1